MAGILDPTLSGNPATLQQPGLQAPAMPSTTALQQAILQQQRLQQGALGAYSKALDQQRGALSEMMTAYQPQTGGIDTALLQLAAGFLSPTRTGGFGESLGYAAQGYGQAVDKRRDQEMDRLGKLNQLKLAQVELATKLPEMQMRMAGQGVDTQKLLYDLQSKDYELRKDRYDTDRFNQSLDNAAGLGDPAGRLTPDEVAAIKALPADEGRKLYAQIMRERAKQKVDFPTVSPQDYDRVAEDFGLPTPNDPYARLSPAGREKAILADRNRIEKLKTDWERDRVQNEAERRKLERMRELAGRVNTGPVWGYTPNMSSDAQEFAANSAELSRQQRQPGEGATSDFDAQQFIKASPGEYKDPVANQHMLTARIEANKLEADRAAFLRDYAEAYGHTSGADAAWQRYTSANTIFDPSADVEKGEITLNENRMDYKSYFRLERQAAADGVDLGKVRQLDVASVPPEKLGDLAPYVKYMSKAQRDALREAAKRLRGGK